MEKKKNPESVALSNQIISLVPASHFRNIELTNTKATTNNSTANQNETAPTETKEQITVADTKPIVVPTTATPTVIAKETSVTTAEITPPPAIKKLDINAPKRVSGLSLSSLKAKQEHKLNKIDVVIDESTLPDDDFTEEKLQELWNIFVDKIEAEGQRILASNLHSDTPTLKDRTTIAIQLPNDTMKKEVEREKFDLMEYLKRNLTTTLLL